MTLGQIALKYMLNILTGSCKEAVEWLNCSCKAEQVDCYCCGGASSKQLLVIEELLCSFLMIHSEVGVNGPVIPLYKEAIIIVT